MPVLVRPTYAQTEYLPAIQYRLDHPAKRVRVVAQIVWDGYEINTYEARVGKKVVHSAEWYSGFADWLQRASIPEVEEAKAMIESGAGWSPPT